MENFGAVDEEPTTSFEMEIEKTVTVESVVETVMDTVADAVVETVADVADEAATGAHSIQGDTWLLNLTSLAEGLQGVNLTDGVNLQGWVLNITALVEDVPLSEYFPILSLKEYAQWLITLVVGVFHAVDHHQNPEVDVRPRHTRDLRGVDADALGVPPTQRVSSGGHNCVRNA